VTTLSKIDVNVTALWTPRAHDPRGLDRVDPSVFPSANFDPGAATRARTVPEGVQGEDNIMSDTATRAGDEPAAASEARSPVEHPADGTPPSPARPLRRLFRHEATVASVAGLSVAVAMNWLVAPSAVWIMSAGATPPVIPVYSLT
jgi:hypothetical protein